MKTAKATRYEGPHVLEITFSCSDLTTFLGLDALGLTAVDQPRTSTRAIVEYCMRSGLRTRSVDPAGPTGKPVGRWPGD